MSATETKPEWQTWFERVWEHREEVVYPSLFGKCSRGIFPVQSNMITGVFQQETFDPRWLHYGVVEFAPNDSRRSWLYATSGMSNDWNADTLDPETPSGLGCEFIFETTEQSDWAVARLLYLMVFQILLCHGRYPGKEPLGDFDRIPLREPICPGTSQLTYLMLVPPPRITREVQLESGPFDFYHVVGITEAEAAYARAHDGSTLLALLDASDYSPVTDPNRSDLTFAER